MICENSTNYYILFYIEDEKKKVFPPMCQKILSKFYRFLPFVKDSFIQKFEIFTETPFVLIFHFSLKNKSSFLLQS